MILGDRDHGSRAAEPLRVLRTWVGDRRDGLVALDGLALVEQIVLPVGGGMDGVIAAGVGYARHMGMVRVDREVRNAVRLTAVTAVRTEDRVKTRVEKVKLLCRSERKERTSI